MLLCKREGVPIITGSARMWRLSLAVLLGGRFQDDVGINDAVFKARVLLDYTTLPSNSLSQCLVYQDTVLRAPRSELLWPPAYSDARVPEYPLQVIQIPQAICTNAVHYGKFPHAKHT